MRIKLIAFSVALSLILASAPVMAADFPAAIWPVLDKYSAAVNAGDDWQILEWGQKSVDIMEAEADSQIKKEFLAGRYEQLSRCAERLGLYDRALAYYKKYIPYGQYMGWSDGVAFAETKIILLTSRLDVFIKDTSYSPPYYGAKFEPRSGVLFGSVYDADPRILGFDADKISAVFPKKNSVYLMYLEFGDDIEGLARYANYFANAKESDTAVELAWNVSGSLSHIESREAYIKKTIDYLAASGLKIFLRFGAEMNLGPSGDDAQSFVHAFRYVADYAKTKPNIAMVWSPGDLGALDRPYDMYYPGDEYVDWVGASLYTIKYFNGKRDHGDQTDILNTYFMAGEYADPVCRLTPLMQFMERRNIQKPVMISECGTPHYIRTENEDTTAWAALRLRQLYGELPRVFPRVKMMCYFNVNMANEANVYSLHDSDLLNRTYNEMVADGYFLSDADSQAGYGYRPFYGGQYYQDDTVSLSAAAYFPKANGSVCYLADGQPLYEIALPPYSYDLNLAGLTEGAHTLSIRYMISGRTAVEKSFEINVLPAIRVFVNNNEVVFPDQRPIIASDRTLVPVRGVFEKMGMTVSWDASTQKVVLHDSETTVTLRLGDKDLIVSKNGRSRTVVMDVPAATVNDRTLVPVRVIAEALDANVGWDSRSNTVRIDF